MKLVAGVDEVGRGCLAGPVIAAAYIELEKDGKTRWGVGINPNTTRASFEAIIVGLSKIL